MITIDTVATECDIAPLIVCGHDVVLQTLKLSNNSQYTVFAPSNLAFDKLQPSVRDKVLSQHGCGPGRIIFLICISIFKLPRTVCMFQENFRRSFLNIYLFDCVYLIIWRFYFSGCTSYRRANTLVLSVSVFEIFALLGSLRNFITKPIQNDPPHLRHFITLPRGIKNSNIPQIFSRHGIKC